MGAALPIKLWSGALHAGAASGPARLRADAGQGASGERADGGTPGKATANTDKDGHGQSCVKSRGPLAIRIELPVIEYLGI